METTPEEIIHFWFEEISPKNWFIKDAEFDQLIRNRFLNTFRSVMSNPDPSWRITPAGRLAEILVLDQFSRNMFRGDPESFSGDVRALILAQEAVQIGDDQKVSINRRGFFYMPYMHSEDPAIHKQAILLFSQKGLEENLKFEILHKNIIDRFGRFPHRNEILGRMTTAEERIFLTTPGSSF